MSHSYRRMYFYRYMISGTILVISFFCMGFERISITMGISEFVVFDVKCTEKPNVKKMYLTKVEIHLVYLTYLRLTKLNTHLISYLLCLINPMNDLTSS